MPRKKNVNDEKKAGELWLMFQSFQISLNMFEISPGQSEVLTFYLCPLQTECSTPGREERMWLLRPPTLEVTRSPWRRQSWVLYLPSPPSLSPIFTLYLNFKLFFIEVERLLLGRSQHCSQTRMDQVWTSLSQPGTDQCLWAKCDKRSSEGVPNCCRKGYWSDRNHHWSYFLKNNCISLFWPDL